MSALDEYRKVWPGGEVSRLADNAIDELEAKLAHEEESNHISIEQWGVWEERTKRAEAERDVLKVAFAQQHDEYVTVVGCISAWVNRLPRELGVAIYEGKKLVEPHEGDLLKHEGGE